MVTRQPGFARCLSDLDHFTEAESMVLQNHGYQLAEVATRRWTPELRDPGAPEPRTPYGGEWLDPPDGRRALRDSHRRRLLGRWRGLSATARRSARR